VSKIVFMTSMSVDGYFEGPDGELDWHLVDAEVHEHFNEVLGAMGAFLDGRVTHELMAEFWPTADQDPASSPTMQAYARIWRDMPKYVYSRTLERADWNTTVVRDVVPAEVEALKAATTGDLSLGGPNLAASFLRHDLVDELRLYVHPIVLGQGRPAFLSSTRHHDLALVETRTFGNGVALLHYGRR
jgi:dihydrofolate reductase